MVMMRVVVELEAAVPAVLHSARVLRVQPRTELSESVTESEPMSSPSVAE